MLMFPTRRIDEVHTLVGTGAVGLWDRPAFTLFTLVLIRNCRDAVADACRIDEVHTLVGTGAVGRGGGGGGGLDISNLMKPALARGELQCIGATTLDEHRKHIEKDQALER